MWCPSLRPNAPRYLAIVEALQVDIEAGALGQGTRLPPQRDLARALGVSIGTVTRAYSLAEERGLVRGEVGRGTYVGAADVDDLPFADTGETLAGGINLGMSWPLEDLNPDLESALAAVKRRSDLESLTRYQPNLGMSRHRRAGARWIAAHGFEVEPDSVAICGGGQHAMTVALSALAKSGDTILVEELTYPGVRAVAEFLGLKMVGVAMDREGLLPESLEQACRTRHPKALYTVPTLHNPTTSTQGAVRRAELAAVAREYGLPIVEDAIHHLLLDPAEAPPLLASYAPELSYLIASPSKVVAGGLRVAYLAAPEPALSELSQRLWATTWMVAPLVAEVMTHWIEDGTALRIVGRKRQESARRLALAHRVLNAPAVGAELRSAKTGYHAWLSLPPAWPDVATLVATAAQQGVVVTGGSAFQVGPGGDATGIRVSISAPGELGTLERGLRILRDVLKHPARLGRAIV